MEQQIQFCTARDGVRLAYATHGSGPALVKVAHWFTHLEHDWHSPLWEHWWHELGCNHRVVRYDLRGCGLSDRSPTDISLETLTDDLESVVEAAHLGRFALLGISGGAGTAIRFALRHPEQVSHLVLLGGYARGRDRRQDDARRRAETELLTSIVHSGWDAATPVFRRVFSSLLVPEATEEHKAWLDELMRLSTSPAMAGRLRQVWAQDDLTSHLAGVTTPTLVIHAREDHMAPFEESRILAAGIPGAQLLPLDSRNHALLPDEPAWQVMVARLHDFLGSTPTIAPRTPLSDREVEVLTLVAAGLSNDRIGTRLHLSTRTVERHLSNAYVKLEVSGRSARAAAAAYLAAHPQT